MPLAKKVWKTKEKCPYCGNWFYPKYYKDENKKSRTCSNPKCVYEHKKQNRKKLIYKTKKALLTLVTPDNVSVCGICKAPFVRKRKDQKTCGNRACRAARGNKTFQERKRLDIEAEELSREKLDFGVCPVCNTTFLKTTPNKKLCGSEECRKEFTNRRQRSRTVEKNETGYVTDIKASTKKKEENFFVIKKYELVIRNCLKCGRPFKTDIMWLCPTCKKINEKTYRWD